LGRPGLEIDDTFFDLMTLKPHCARETIYETGVVPDDVLRLRRIA
jgi:hypothetical protein